VQRNFQAVDETLAHLYKVKIPVEFVRNVLGPMIAGDGDALPVSALPVDGTYLSGTSRWEKRNIALEIPEWDPTICIQCGKCVMVCMPTCRYSPEGL
jgi:pyruvate-ferredoxin/flavodoxin oxidoreductase